MTDFRITVKGDKQVARMLRDLEVQVVRDVNRKMEVYSNFLVNRIKERLQDAATPRVSTKGIDGLRRGGGYGTPKNPTEYADWKASKGNLPVVGDATTEMIATGFFVEMIGITKLLKMAKSFSFSVGPGAGQRAKTVPFKDGPAGDADLSKSISNIKLAQLLEDSDYQFWAKEFEDVHREIKPYLEHIIKRIIVQLLKKHGGILTTVK